MLTKVIIVSTADAATLWEKRDEFGCEVTECRPFSAYSFKVEVKGPEDKVVEFFKLIGERIYAYCKKD